MCIPLGSLDLTDPGERWYQLHDFVETGVILPVSLTSSSSADQGPRRQGSPSHRGRANAFSRSTTPASRPGSTKSLESGDRESKSQSPVPAPPNDNLEVAAKSMPRQASTDSDTYHQHLVIPQGEKRGSADSIIPVINIEGESDQDSEEK